MIKRLTLLLLSMSMLFGCQSKQDALLYCQPERPLSKGVLFERAMIDHWHDTFGYFWGYDQLREEDYIAAYGSLDGFTEKDEIKNTCGLTKTWLGRPDKVTKAICLPQIIRRDVDFKQLDYDVYLKKHPNASPEEYYKALGAIAYSPYADYPAYSAEFYNQDTDFIAVLHIQPYVYPKDCCRLLDYQQAVAYKKQEYKDRGLDSPERMAFAEEYIATSVPASVSAKDYHFLVIKRWNFVLETMYYHYMPVNSCGEIINHRT